ncbi:DUF2723 domain-containing protein [Candidatus Woesebacteria bacterium]|nr:DUF2723 domain-containing protein [Candidatus Woesebacteria bacterium]
MVLTQVYLWPILPLMRKYFTAVLGILAFLIPLGLYLKTLSPTYIPIDSAEFALCMKFWGLCHPPGFPLYVAVGHYFVEFFPFGSLIYKANLISAIFGSLTVLVVYLTLLRLGVNKVTSLLLCLFLAVNAVFWEFSLAADVFTFGAFLIALSFFLVVRETTLAAFFVLGLSASHFYISAILWPVLAWYFITNSKFKVQSSKLILNIVLWGAAFVLGFFPQAIMYWRMQQSPEINWGHAEGLSGFLYYVRRQEFGSIFLLANPALTFHLGKTIKHLALYFQSLFVTFGVILPFIALGGAFFGVFKNRKFTFLIISFFILAFVQLFLLSTIDPAGENNPFQINKFYLSTFVFVPLIAGISLEAILKKTGWERGYVYLLLGFLIVIYFLSSLRINDYSENRFSERFVSDGLSTLPEDSAVITVNHVFYFGGLYEQKVNGRYKNVKLLYFPNEKNRDSEKYNPELFSGEIDSDFVKKVSKNKNLGAAEKYVLGTIAKNLDKKIYILQGSFEEGFFAFLAPYLRPYGLWWYVEPDLSAAPLSGQSKALFDAFLNKGLTVGDLMLKQQKIDLLTYAVGLHSTAVGLGAEGRYDEAIELFERSRIMNPSSASNIDREIDLLRKTRELAVKRDEYLKNGDKEKLNLLGNNYFTVKNFAECEKVFAELSIIEEKAEIFNNLASCQASQGKTEPAKENYRKALSIDFNFELSKQGLSALE